MLFPAGSSADITARLLADGMSKHLPGNVIVVNRPGAGGAIGYKYVASQKPDGYALVWNSNSISTTYHSGLLPVRLPCVRPGGARAGRVAGAGGACRRPVENARRRFSPTRERDPQD